MAGRLPVIQSRSSASGSDPSDDSSENGQLRSKGLLPALGVGGAVYLVTGVVSLGTLAMVGVGAGVGYGVGSWLSDQYEKKKAEKEAANNGGRRSSAAMVPESLQVSLMQWQVFLSQRSGGQELNPEQMAQLFAEFSQLEPAHAQNVQFVQAQVAQGGGTPVVQAAEV